jgi:uncharacterized protein YbjT (DUF2867 family)
MRVRVLTWDRTRAANLTSELIEVVEGDVRDRASCAKAVEGVRTVICSPDHPMSIGRAK